jgi:tRNA threonylcarbamoyladenosine biosynthesis protein TsaE
MPHVESHFESHLPDEAATGRCGARLAACLAPGFRLYLRGELGSGKTTLVRGLLGGLGYRGRVKSPTYTLVELYAVSRLDLYHFDFYRFRDPEEWDGTGFRDYFDSAAACVVEWPERAGDLIPPPDLELVLLHAESGRDIRMRALSAAGERCLMNLPDA